MEVKKNVVAAIATALHFYMEAEQQAPVSHEEKKVAELPRPAYSPWAMSGRQAAMEMRRFWQMRLVR